MNRGRSSCLHLICNWLHLQDVMCPGNCCHYTTKIGVWWEGWMINEVLPNESGIHRLLRLTSATRAARSSVRLERGRELEDYAAIVVLFLRGLEVEIGESDLARVAGSQVKERCADDSVISDFEFVAVLENQNG